MISDLPDPSMRPGMFISVGPAGYTATALVSLGSQAQTILSGTCLGVTSVPVGDVLHIMGTFSGIFIWLLIVLFLLLVNRGCIGRHPTDEIHAELVGVRLPEWGIYSSCHSDRQDPRQ